MIDLSNKPLFEFNTAAMGTLQVSRFISRNVIEKLTHDLEKFKQYTSLEATRMFASFVCYKPDSESEDGSINEKFRITIDEAKLL